MSIKSDLKKEGINVTSELDTLKVNSIAKNIAQTLVAAFPEHDFKLGELFIRISRIHMYMAEVPNGYSEANYFYKNTSIYFNEKIKFEDIYKYAIHECIHYLQERKDKKGHLERLGLCDLTGYKVTGLGMNEAAVQLATSKALNSQIDNVKYFDIAFDTISPNCYPLECCLINQMAYITGEYILFDSTFNSTNDFKNKFISLTDEETFEKIQNNFDKLLKYEEELIVLNNKLELAKTSSSASDLNNKKNKVKDNIRKVFFSTQDLILTSYFDNAFDEIKDLESVENFRRKLYNYKNIVGQNDNYTYYNNYYINMMSKLENAYNAIENGTFNKQTSLSVIKHNRLTTIISAIKNLFFSPKESSKDEIK